MTMYGGLQTAPVNASLWVPSGIVFEIERIEISLIYHTFYIVALGSGKIILECDLQEESFIPSDGKV